MLLLYALSRTVMLRWISGSFVPDWDFEYSQFMPRFLSSILHIRSTDSKNPLEHTRAHWLRGSRFYLPEAQRLLSVSMSCESQIVTLPFVVCHSPQWLRRSSIPDFLYRKDEEGCINAVSPTGSCLQIWVHEPRPQTRESSAYRTTSSC